MSLIFFASTDVLSGDRTSRFTGPFLRWLKPDISEHRIRQVQLIVRKGGHLTEYAILCALLWRALREPEPDVPSRWKWSRATVAWSLAAIYAITDEYHQSFVSSRYASGWDVMIDALGAAIGLVLLWAWGRRRQKC